MPELTREDIVEAVREAMANHPCRFDVRPKDIDHLIGMILDVGGGDLRAGIESLRQHHLWLVARIKVDDEFSANHEAMSGLRHVTKTFGEKVAHAAMWFFLFLMAAGLVIFGASKAGCNLTDVLRK